MFTQEPVSFVEFDKFQEGDIITFKEGIPREVSCTAFQSLPAAHVKFKVGDKIHGGVKTKSQVQKLFSLPRNGSIGLRQAVKELTTNETLSSENDQR